MRKLTKLAMACALGVAAVALAAGAGYSADEKAPTIKEIMVQGHKGTDAFMAKIKAEAKAGKWDDAKQHAKALAVFGEAMPKLKPKKGSEESWKALSTKYAESTKATLAAVEKKDAAAVNKALGGINCMECHKAHRGK